MPVSIINDRIDGLRITVYDVVHYLESGASPAEIMASLPLTLEQVEGAIQYIEAHKDEVMAVHRQIEARIARGNPPEIEEHLRQSRAKMQAWLCNRQRAQAQEANGEGHPGGRQ